MSEEREMLDVVSLVSLRKSDLYQTVLEEIPEDQKLSEQEKKKLSIHISKMDFREFLTEEEIENKRLSPGNKLEDLNLDKKSILEQLDIETK